MQRTDNSSWVMKEYTVFQNLYPSDRDNTVWKYKTGALQKTPSDLKHAVWYLFLQMCYGLSFSVESALAYLNTASLMLNAL